MSNKDEMIQKKPEIPRKIQQKWQRIVDLIRRSADVPAGLIMKAHLTQIEVFVVSKTQNNPYEKGELADLNTGLYCETVMNRRKPLHIPDALADPEWAHNPDIKLGMTYYLGFPIQWPDGEMFGTICILDTKDNLLATRYRDILFEFKEVVESDLRFILDSVEKEKLVAKLQGHKKDLKQKIKDGTIELKKQNKALSKEIKKHKQAQQTIQAIVKSTAGVVGQEFFDNIVSTLCHWLDCEIALIGKVTEGSMVETLAMQMDGRITNKYYYSLIGTPCKNVYLQKNCVYPENVTELFPENKDLVKFGVEGYIGCPLQNMQGRTVGILTVMSRKKIILADKTQKVMGIFAARVAAEIDRLQVEEALKLNQERLEALLRLTQMEGLSEQELAAFALEEGVRLTGSKGGYLHFYDENLKNIRLHSWSRQVQRQCSVTGTSHYPLESAGIWADSIRNRQPVIHNNYDTVQGKKGLREGHFPINRHISVPIFDGKKIIAIAGAANKSTDYSQSDVDQLSLLMINTWQIIQKKKVQKLLQENERRFRTIFDQAPMGIVLIDSNTKKFLKVNHKFSTIIGYSEDELIKMDIQAITHPDDFDKRYHNLEQLRKGKMDLFKIEKRFLQKDGHIIWINLTVVPMWDNDTSHGSYLAMIEDISERKKTENALKSSEKNLRLLSSRLQETEEIFRKELARELHDQAGQSLAALNINLTLLENQLKNRQLNEMPVRLADSITLVEDTTRAIRDVMADLRPSVLDDYGLKAALRWHCERFAIRNNIIVSTDDMNFSARLPESLESALFRISQEAMNNIAKYAGADQAWISLKDTADHICLTIKDNGIGFDTCGLEQPKDSKGWGILNMTERVQALGGTLDISSEPGKGTMMTVTIRKNQI